MPHLLRIDASSRLEGSKSRELGDYFERAWLARGAARVVTRRDLAINPVENIRQSTIAGFYTASEHMMEELRAATALSDQLIAELKHADELLITTPMYNFTAPAALKAWIDQIVRINHTFTYDGQNFTGLLQTRRAVLATAYGAAGYLNGGPFAGADHCTPYLTFMLSFLGIKHIEHIAVEGTVGDAEALARHLAQARRKIELAAA